MLSMSAQAVLSSHLSSSEEEPHCPDVETALAVFTFHGRLSAHLQLNHVGFASRSPFRPSVTGALTFRFFFFPLSAPSAFQSLGSREYLASLERTAAWVAERVLPFLVQSGHNGEAKEEETAALAAHITKVRFGLSLKSSNLLPPYNISRLMCHLTAAAAWSRPLLF